MIGRGIYSKGLLHNGSHLIDLARYLFGEVASATPLYESIDDDTHKPTVAGFLTFTNCPQFHLAVANEKRYGVFELDILAENARIRLTEHGFACSIQRAQEDKRYPGFPVLGKAIIKKTGLPQAMYRLIDNSVAHLEKKSTLLCSGREVLRTQEICELLLFKALKP